MDYKSTIFIFGAALIFIIPLINAFDGYGKPPDRRALRKWSGIYKGYRLNAARWCDGNRVDGDFEGYNIDDAINGCNRAASCECVERRPSGTYYLYQGTERKYQSGWEAWVKDKKY